MLTLGRVASQLGACMTRYVLGVSHVQPELQMPGEGMSMARDLRDGYDDSCRWLLQEGLTLCLFENLTGTEIAAVQTEAKSGMIFGEKSNNWFMSSEKASHSLAISPV